MDDFERELREMLDDRVATMPDAFDAPPVLLQRARRRRTTKLTALAASVVIVAGGAAGAIAQIAGDDSPRRVITTAPTSTLPRPGVRTVACEKDYPNNVRGTRVLPPSRPRVPTAGDPAILSTLAWFAESVEQDVIVLGPASWSCHFPVGDGMVVYDPVATAGAVPTVDEAPILVENGYPWQDPAGARIACSVFDDAAVMDHVNASDISGCVQDRTPRRTVTRVDSHLATFIDADGSRGVAWLQLPSSKTAYDGSVSVLRCRPTEGLTAAACDTIVAEYSARLSEPRVQNVGCPSTTDAAEERPSSSTAPTTEPAVPTATTAGHPPPLQYFGGWGADPRYVVLGPDSWSCLQRFTERGVSTVVYDPNATPGQVPRVDAASIALQNEVWEGQAGARLLCSVFDDMAAVEFARHNYPDSCLTAPAPGRTVTRVSGNFATFVDATGDRGAGWMIPPSPETQEPGRIAVLTCRSSAELTIATCDAIVADYAAQLDDGSPLP